MAGSRSDALVVFGVTGDLAHKQIFPALYAMEKRGELKAPVIGVAFPKWSLERLQRRVADSIQHAAGGMAPKNNGDRRALDALLSRIAICERRLQGPGDVCGDQAGAGWGAAAGALPGDSSVAV